MTTLDLLGRGGRATVMGFDESLCDERSRCRLQELGFRVGETVEMIRVAPMGDPVLFRVCDYDMCLRKRDARLIQVGTSL